MAVADVQRDGENEARLRRERLASSRPLEDAAQENRERMAGARPSDAAARENMQRFSGASWQPPPPVAPSSPAGGAEAMRGVAREQALENQLNRQRRQEEKPEKENANLRAPSLRDAAALAKASPAGAAGGALLKAGMGRGLSTEEIQKGVGRSCVMQLWSFLWPSFGHTIYLLILIFWIAWASKFARKFVPEVGEEWFPSQLLQKIPKPMLIPIKMAEVVGLFFILFWVFMFDMLCIGILAFLLGAIMDVANIV